jgi:hypothetical protein
MQASQELLLPISATIALSSLCVWASVAWKTTFRPAQLVGLLSSLAIFRLQQLGSGPLSDVVFVPLIWIRNLGARPAVVEDVRLRFTGEGGRRIYSYPGYTLTKEDALKKELDRTLDGKREIFPGGDLFSGFSLSADEYWIKSYAFIFRDLGDLETLVNTFEIKVEIRMQGEAGGGKSLTTASILAMSLIICAPSSYRGQVHITTRANGIGSVSITSTADLPFRPAGF